MTTQTRTVGGDAQYIANLQNGLVRSKMKTYQTCCAIAFGGVFLLLFLLTGLVSDLSPEAKHTLMWFGGATAIATAIAVILGQRNKPRMLCDTCGQSSIMH